MAQDQDQPASPVHAGDFPDPFVLGTEGGYFAYATQTGGTNVQVMKSDDLTRWEHRGDALPQLPQWAEGGNTWAPAVVRRGDRYVLYYTVRHKSSGRQCVSVAAASDPAGPFVDGSTEPLVLQVDRGGSIDPSPFVDGDGTPYLLWKSDDNAVGRAPSLWGAPLRGDGGGLAGDPVELLRHDCAWEAPLIEAPSLARVSAGAYVLFYSGGWWQSVGYAMGYATGGAPLGPFDKQTGTGPWLAAGPGRAGPGGGEVFTDAAGKWRIAFHAWTPPKVGYALGGARSLWVERLDFENGRPVLG